MVCLTIDGDLYNNVEVSKKAIHFTIKFLEFFGINGKVTWFINEEFGWTKHYINELRSIVAKGNEIGLHVHKINEDVRKGKVSSVEELKKVFKKYKTTLEKVTGNKIVSFRSGAHAHTPQMFTALSHLDFYYDSSIIPGKIIYVDKELYPHSKNDIYVDNRRIKKRKVFYISNSLCVKEVPNSKWKYFHPIDLVRKDGSYNVRNIFKWGVLISLYKFLGIKKINEIYLIRW